VLTPRFWVIMVLTGIAAGLLGALMMLLLFNVQYAAFGYHEGTLQHGAGQASAVRRVASLLIAGAFGGVAWFLLRRYTMGEPSEIDEALWNGDGRLSLRHGLDIPARSRHLPRHPRLPVHLVGDDLGAAGRAGHRAGLRRLHPAHRLGVASSRQGDRRAAG
jgi:hypothetical protein